MLRLVWGSVCSGDSKGFYFKAFLRWGPRFCSAGFTVRDSTSWSESDRATAIFDPGPVADPSRSAPGLTTLMRVARVSVPPLLPSPTVYTIINTLSYTIRIPATKTPLLTLLNFHRTLADTTRAKFDGPRLGPPSLSLPIIHSQRLQIVYRSPFQIFGLLLQCQFPLF